MQYYAQSLKNSIFGVEKLSFSLGLAFIFFCIFMIKASVTEAIFIPLGIYCLTSLFVFSIAPFCHDEYESIPVFNWHIPYLCEELQKLSKYIVHREPKPYDLIVNIPPGTTKSTIVTIMWPVWLWTQDPTIRIITNSYSGGLSIEHATK